MQGRWAPTSIKSESSRLNKILPYLSTTDAFILSRHLEQAGKGGYTIKTTLIRASEFLKFLGYQDNPYSRYLYSNRKQLQGVYKPERLTVTFEEARARILTIPNRDTRQLALFILHSGLRSTEALSYQQGTGFVVGKGSRERAVFNAQLAPTVKGTYLALYLALKKVGLKPHMLRKLAATKLAASGFKDADLLKVMGWTTMQTAAIYLQPAADAELAVRIKQAMEVE